MCSIGTASSSSSVPMSLSSLFTGPSGTVTLEDRPRSPPTKLTRFAPDRRDWVLYDSDQENEFLSWWLETDYGQQLTKNGQYKFRWSIESRSSKVWKHFDQVAELRSGRPKVACRSCLIPLNHPHHPHHKSHGTSTMGKHLPNPGASCELLAREEQIHQGTARRTAGADNHVRKTFFWDHGRTHIPRIVGSSLFRTSGFGDSLIKAAPPAYARHSNIYQESQLQDLPGDSKVSVALCLELPRGACLDLSYFAYPRQGLTPVIKYLDSLKKKGCLVGWIFSMTIDYRVDEKLALSLQEKFTSSGGISSWQCFVGVPGTVQAIQLCLRRYIENITSSPEGERVENVRAISHVNGWTDPSDGGDMTHILGKVNALHPLD
ncbi:unnamed protein product [Penicillium nalgiovense]|nr:unnamed protein product [Penicillium nalgiovense]